MKKRILSILLLCCMVLTMQPIAAFAAVSDSLGNTPEENQGDVYKRQVLWSLHGGWRADGAGALYLRCVSPVFY